MKFADLFNPPKAPSTATTGVAGRVAGEPRTATTGAAGHPWVDAMLRGVLAEFRTTLEGERNDNLNRAAFRIGQYLHYLDRSSVEADLMAAAKDTGLPTGEARATIQSGLDGGQKYPKEPNGHSESLGQLVAAPLPEGEAAGLPDSWCPVDLTKYLDGTYTPPQPELLTRTDGQALLYRGLTHSMHGEPESGKSLVAQAEAARILAQGGHVLFLDFESDPASVVGRLLALGAPPDTIGDGLDYRNPETSPLATETSRAAWLALLDRTYDLAVIDGVTAALGAVGGSTNENDDVTQFIRQLPDRIARCTGAAVVVIDHVVKNAETRGRYALGGQAKLAALTGAAYMVEIAEPLGRGMRGVVVLRVAKDRPGAIRTASGPYRVKDRTQESARVVIDSTGPATIVTIEPPDTDQDDTAFRPTELMHRVSDLLESEPAPMSQSAITSQVIGKKAAVILALKTLIREGYVATSSGPRNAVLHALVKPFRNQPDAGTGQHQQPAQSGSLTGSPPGGGNRELVTHRVREPVGNWSGTGNRSGGNTHQSPPQLQLVQSEQPTRYCADCGEPLDPALADAGESMHPNCGDQETTS